MNRVPRPLPHTLIALLILAAPLAAQSKAERKPLDPLGIRTLTAAAKGAARITVHGATGAARFVRLEGAPSASLAPATAGAASTPQDKMAAFFAAHGRIFGIR